MKYGKRLRKTYEAVDTSKVYDIQEAVKLIKDNSTAKFDETVDIAVSLGVDPRQSDQMIRGAVSLPNGTGKTLSVAVFAKGPKAEEAKKAGADIVGDEDLMQDIMAGVEKDNYEIVYDRREAIKKAISIMEPNDIVLILGKGHEDYQIIGHEKVHLDDSEEVKKYI